MEAENGQVITMSRRSSLPEFNSNDPVLWFALAESFFTKWGVVDMQSRYLEVLAVLPTRITNEVRDVIVSPLTNESYTNLKQQIIKRLSTSQEEKSRQLLEDVHMGHEKPSQYLRRLQALAGTTMSEDLLRTLWMRGLPARMKPTMATQQDKSLEAMAEVADTVYGLVAEAVVAEASVPKNSSRMSDVTIMQQMAQEIEAIKVQLENLGTQRKSRFSSRGSRNNRSHSRRRSNSMEQSWCFYHKSGCQFPLPVY